MLTTKQVEDLLKEAYRVISLYKWDGTQKGLRLKDVQMWTEIKVLCKVLEIDDCWFFQQLTGLHCDCNLKTKNKAKPFLI